MASQSTLIQQLLKAEKQAAEKVSEARKSKAPFKFKFVMPEDKNKMFSVTMSKSLTCHYHMPVLAGRRDMCISVTVLYH